jgi:hypothetical protein
MEVLQRAAARKANLIIAHEPTFYNHLDETAWLGDDPSSAACRGRPKRRASRGWA